MWKYLGGYRRLGISFLLLQMEFLYQEDHAHILRQQPESFKIIKNRMHA